MNTQHHLNLLQRGLALFGAVMVTISLLGGIDQLAHQPQVADAWAGKAAAVQPA